MIKLLPFVTLSLLATACVVEEDRCVEHRSELGFDEASPWGPTPREAVGHAVGVRTGTVTWHEGGSAGALAPTGTEAGLTLSLVIDEASAIAVDREHVGGGRLACVPSFELAGTLTLDSDDGALQEQLAVTLVAPDGVLGDQVEGTIDLADHDFVGSFAWTPSAADEALFLRVSWVDDQPQTARGWLIWGEAAQTEIVGNEVTGAGVGQVLADFEAAVAP